MLLNREAISSVIKLLAGNTFRLILHSFVIIHFITDILFFKNVVFVINLLLIKCIFKILNNATN